jgi:hypothetical protein
MVNGWSDALDQLHPLQAGVPILADDNALWWLVPDSADPLIMLRQ